MSGIPTVVFTFLGLSPEKAKTVGMSGCSLQLDDQYEYDWKETSILMSKAHTEFKMFCVIEGISFDDSTSEGLCRITIQQMEEYINLYPSISSFLEMWEETRFLRLGRRARLPPYELDSYDAFLVRMPRKEFDSFFVSDPRGPLSYAELANSAYFLHKPLMKKTPEGLPAPGSRGWIRLSSIA